MKNSSVILGPYLSGVRGKTVIHKPDHVTIYYVALPRDFLKVHKFVTLVTAVISVNNIPFMITMSSCIRVITVEHVSTHTYKKLGKRLKIIIRLYLRVNFCAKYCNGYGV